MGSRYSMPPSFFLCLLRPWYVYEPGLKLMFYDYAAYASLLSYVDSFLCTYAHLSSSSVSSLFDLVLYSVFVCVYIRIYIHHFPLDVIVCVSSAVAWAGLSLGG